MQHEISEPGSGTRGAYGLVSAVRPCESWSSFLDLSSFAASEKPAGGRRLEEASENVANRRGEQYRYLLISS